MPADTPTRCLSVRQLAVYLRVAPRTVRDLIRSRQLRAIDVGVRRPCLRIPPDSLAELMDRRAAVKPHTARRRRGTAMDPEVAAWLDG